jgi:hypothetical protein
MREDIAKVVVERPRTGGHYKLSGPYRDDFEWRRLVEEEREDDSPLGESIKLKYGWGRKSLNDFLSPLRGFLRKSVGRPWDDVYSEACQYLKPVSVMQRHVLEHLNDYVEKHVIREPDGKVTDSCGRPLRSFNRGTFYVDPDDGILRQVDDTLRRAWRSHRATKPELAVDPKRPYVQDKNGVWFEVKLETLPITSAGWVNGGNLLSSEAVIQARKRDNLLYLTLKRGVAFGTAYDVWFKEHAVGGRVMPWNYGYSGAALGANRVVETDKDETVPKKLMKHWMDGGVLYCSWKRQLGKQDKKRLGLK